MPALDLTATSIDLTRTICDIPSVSDDETVLADAIHDAVLALPHLDVYRDGDTIVARTNLGRTSASRSPDTSTPFPSTRISRRVTSRSTASRTCGAVERST